MTIQLSDEIALDARQLASQGNAILGIRDSGKTYSATLLAERVHSAGIPFIAFDPIGVWRCLKVPGVGPGLPVVVAGENADFPLNPDSAPEIVRAAMRENISLVLDLYSMQLSKADWRKIVESSVRLLLFENKQHGLRHIFLEEAAEFIPQRVGPESGRVYAEIEKLARMGGNAALGYTIINQRAEEVNKAVLELCDCLFLHRQKGRNSLTALAKWLDFADAGSSKEIVRSLPTLGQGQCWVWMQGASDPKILQMPLKRSLHPDRRNLVADAAQAPATDVSSFVARLQSSLKTIVQQTRENDPAALKREVEELKAALAAAKNESAIPENQLARLEALRATIDALAVEMRGMSETLAKLTTRPAANNPARSQPVKTRPAPAPTGDGGSVQGGMRRMLIALAQRPDGLSDKQLGVRAGLSSSSGTFGTYLAGLRQRGLLHGDRSQLTITPTGLRVLGEFDPLPEGAALYEYWRRDLGEGGCSRMLQALYEAHPNTLSAREVGERAGISHESGTFGTYLAKLRALELVSGGREALKASAELF